MSDPEPSFTLGVEEEYLIVDGESGELVAAPPRSFFAACEKRLGPHVTNEFLQSQIEVGTQVCTSVAQAAGELAALRATVAECAAEDGLAPIAASTHPFADWHSQRQTPKKRYDELHRDMQGVAERLLICGMHIHVAVEDPDLRIDLFNQLPYFLPHLLALSTSSPFWQGHDTGLASYRLSVFDALPRTGLPEAFDSFAEYQRTLETMTGAGLIDNGTKIWWDLRLSARFPTLEMRVTDVCTRVDDAVAIAALYLCVVRMLYRLRRDNQRWRAYSRFLIDENRWRAQRYGVTEGLVDFGRGAIVPIGDLIEELIELVAEDAAYFQCTDAIAHARDIVTAGTSADRQRRRYTQVREAGGDHLEALREVVRMLVAETALAAAPVHA